MIMDGVNISNTNAASTRGISGFHLKVIAVISMFIDHLGATVVYGLMTASYGMTSGTQVSGGMEQVLIWIRNHWDTMWSVYDSMRLIGRIAFPIYCFLIVEGFLHTRNVGKYALRLGIFALISEIPFDLAFNEGWWDMSSNNVFFTLLIGLLVVWGISYIQKAYVQCVEKNWNMYLMRALEILAVLLIVCIGGYIANRVLCTDYGAAGVVTIVIMYLYRKKPWMAFLLAVMVLTLMTNSSELVAIVGAVLVCYYNGTRGKNIKYFFYAFYPVHLLLLWLITVLLGV